ncbi:creatininase [Crenobacter caeni]|uniref:Creatininase n=1 Tax=Crenobacter caeni TaxID=2705474 RepID=A0A6B2KTK5_9NEIS|nr:creatininase [Crenobacter caeni]NDV13390.1 creatininase [Crenobacter caeni]
MKSSVHMYELDSFTYRKLACERNKVLMLPVGAVEQHGPHMSMNVDVLLPTKVAEVVAARIGALVAPPMMFGYKSQQRSGGGNHICGTTSLDGHTLTDVAKTLIKEYVRHGFRRFVLVNGHYENNYFLIEGIDLALRELRWEGIDDAKVILLSYWDFVNQQTIERLYPEGFTGWDLEHGGVLETSLMLHLYPELVDMSRVQDLDPAVLPNYDVYPVKPELTPPSGCLSSAAKASREKGKLLLDVCVEGISHAIDKEFALA